MTFMFTKTAEFFATMALTASGAATAQADAVGEKLVAEFWSRVFGLAPDFEAIERLCTRDFILTTAGRDVVGRAAFTEWARDFRTHTRGMQLVSNDMFTSADGGSVISRWTVAETPVGVDRGREFSGMTVWEVREGKLARHRIERSTIATHQRLPIQPFTQRQTITSK
jgi:hypothetical protein